MLLLAIDTSTTAISVALHDGVAVVAERATLDAKAHAEHLAPNIRAALAEAGATPMDLTHVVCGTGPGPFTGLRVGIVTAVTMAYALDLPVGGLCSLDALAHDAWLGGQRGDLLVATDARRKEVYWAAVSLGDKGIERTNGPHVAKADDLDAAHRCLPALGRGPLLYPDALTRLGPVSAEASAHDAYLDVRAGALADLAVRRLLAGQGLESTEPLYLRRPDAAPAVGVVKSALG